MSLRAKIVIGVALATTLLPGVIVWGLFSFVVMGINPVEWSVDSRMGSVMLTLIFELVAWAAVGSNFWDIVTEIEGALK